MDKKFNIAHYIILGIWIVMGLDWFFDFFSQEVGISIMIFLLISETIVYSIQVRSLKNHIDTLERRITKHEDLKV